MTKLITGLLASTAVLLGAAQAAVVTEQGDAGQTADTAQNAPGATVIDGSLIDLGNEQADIDFYRIDIADVDAFAVSVTADLSVDNDTELFLFDENLNLILADDDGGEGFLSAFVAGELADAGGTAGTYFLAITLFAASVSDGALISVDPSPFQTGSYSLALDGIAADAVPLPAAAWLFGAGLAGLAGARRRANA